MLLVDVPIQSDLGVRVREGSLRLKVVGQDLDRISNMKTLEVVGVLVDVVKSLNLTNKHNKSWLSFLVSGIYREMLARVDIQLFQLEPQQILQSSVCQGTFSKTQAMDLNLHEIVL